MSEPSGIERLREELVHENPWFRIYFDHVRFPNGNMGRHIRVSCNDKGPAIVIIPVNASGEIALVRIYRYPMSSWQWELPRGGGDDPDWRVSASAELAEEIGCAAAEMDNIGIVASDTGIIDTSLHVVFATGASQLQSASAREADQGAIAESRFFPPAGIASMIRAGEITDGVTISALTIAMLKGKLSL